MKTSIILPCRNEEAALGACLDEIRAVMEGVDGGYEVIVSDSSTDRSPQIAKEHGAALVKHNKPGYGNAYLEAYKLAKGDYIFMADADGTYDFKEIPKFVEKLGEGFDLVVGNRFAGKIEGGSMPWLHRRVGNPLLSLLFRVLFRSGITDIHSGMRGIRRTALERLELRTTGMEFATEMLIKAVRKNLSVAEVPIDYRRRKGRSKLKPLSDGWRHLRFMLLYSPMALFLVPGMLLSFSGIASMAWLYFGSPSLVGLRFYYHPMFVSALLLVSGYQLMIFSLFARTYAATHLGEQDLPLRRLHRHFTLENGILWGTALAAAGAAIYGLIFIEWTASGFGNLQEAKNSIVALTLLVIGVQTVFSSFMLSMLGIREK
ncbi:MAG: glycosyltransferase family 2 protein [Candidatus Altiarchaeota archaeon]